MCGVTDGQTVPLFLSCVYRLNQRFGVAHTIDVLRGKKTEKVEQFGHQLLSTFAIGADLSQNQWRSIARQLMVRGYLRTDAERFNALTLTDSARELLKGDVSLQLRQDEIQTKLKKPAQERRSGVSDEDNALWLALRECRKRLADEHDIPPYMVFHDATLMEMMELHPQNSSELLNINGVGESKLEKFGGDFLAVINSHLATA